jgi:hypothetical protein
MEYVETITREMELDGDAVVYGKVLMVDVPHLARPERLIFGEGKVYVVFIINHDFCQPGYNGNIHGVTMHPVTREFYFIAGDRRIGLPSVHLSYVDSALNPRGIMYHLFFNEAPHPT